MTVPGLIDGDPQHAGSSNEEPTCGNGATTIDRDVLALTPRLSVTVSCALNVPAREVRVVGAAPVADAEPSPKLQR